jgi:hypothetical protein
VRVTLLLVLACGRSDPDRFPDGPRFEPAVPADPGRTTLSRLNSAQYDATVAALFGTDLTPGRSFPPDETAFGFDNLGEALSTSSIHVEMWEEAAADLLAELFGDDVEETVQYGAQGEGPGVTYSGEGVTYDSTAYALYEGALEVPLSVDHDGTFDLTARVMGRTVGGEAARMQVFADGILLAEELLLADYTEYQYHLDLGVGLHQFELQIANPGSGLGGQRAVIVDWVELLGPTDPESGPSEAWDRFIPCSSDGLPSVACSREAVGLFGLAAWRRPLTEADVDWAMSLHAAALAEGREADDALELAFTGILLAPEFLYRIEADAEPGEAVRALDGYEVATRLATFLWSANPDDALLTAAGDGSLLAGDNLEETVRRLLADERSGALVDNLAGQWFDLRSVDAVAPDPVLYPTFDDELRESMREGMARAADGFFRGDHDLHELLLRETVWVDARLGAEDVVEVPPTPDGWAEVAVPGRVGLLGTMGWLAVQSHADQPSAVRRGRWVLDNLLCSPPPPPPPDVEGVFEPIELGGSMREQEEAMRSSEFCQSCHSTMDPLGFVFGGFDAMGAPRTVDELGYPIDTESEIDGVPLSSPVDVAAWVTADPRLTRCVVEKTLTFALGRSMRAEDGPELDRLTQRFEEGGLTFEALAVAIATSDSFLWRAAPVVE